jgi:hypothetical protein
MVAGIRPSLTSEKAKRAPGHVAGGDDARSAAHGVALDHRHRQGGNVVQGLQHFRQAHGVVAVVALGPAGGVAHPVQIGPGAEGAARPPNEDGPHPVRAVQRFERLVQGRDGRRIEGVLLGRTVDGDEDDAVGGRIDLHQIVVGVRRRIGHQRLGDAVDLGRLGVGDVQGVEVGFGRLIGHGGLQTACPLTTRRGPIGYIRNRPNVVSGIGAFRLALMARPSTSRVWAGSMTPSSHRRAVA